MEITFLTCPGVPNNTHMNGVFGFLGPFVNQFFNLQPRSMTADSKFSNLESFSMA